MSVAIKLSRIVIYGEELHTAHKITWPFKTHGHARSRHKLETFYLHNHNAYSNQMWQAYGGRAVTYHEGFPTRKPITIHHLVLQDHMENYKFHIPTTTMPVTNKLTKMVRYG